MCVIHAFCTNHFDCVRYITSYCCLLLCHFGLTDTVMCSANMVFLPRDTNLGCHTLAKCQYFCLVCQFISQYTVSVYVYHTLCHCIITAVPIWAYKLNTTFNDVEDYENCTNDTICTSSLLESFICACKNQLLVLVREGVANCYITAASTPIPSARQHPSYGVCLEVKREYYQNSSVLDCVTQCSQSTAAHLCDQFLQVQQIGFVTLGPLRCA